MAFENVIIDTRQLSGYIRSLTSVQGRMATLNARWVKKFAKHTEGKMKRFSRPRTERGTGKLSSSITTEFNLSLTSVGATVFVPEKIEYQFAAEYGFRRRFAILGRPKMTFPLSSWKNAAVKVPNRGYFVFVRVRRGRYKGLMFTERAFKSLKTFYSSNEQRILNDLGNVVLFSRS